MSFAFVAAAQGDTAGATAHTCNKPAGTAEGDIMVAIHGYYLSATESGPTGWTELGAHANGNYKQKLYYKIAGAGEGASYTWTVADTYRGGVTIATFRGGFDAADPIDAVSNTEYVVSDYVARAASALASFDNNIIVYAAINDNSNTTGWTAPTSPAAFTEDADHDGPNFCRTIAHLVWAGSGATGNIDGTFADSLPRTTSKHAFAVILNRIYVLAQMVSAEITTPMTVAEVVFDLPIDTTTAEDETKWTITKDGGGGVPGFTCVKTSATTVEITFDSGLDGVYTVEATNVLDVYGVALDPAHDSASLDALPAGGGNRGQAIVFF